MLAILAELPRAPQRWLDRYRRYLDELAEGRRRLGGQCLCGAAAMSDDSMCSECRAEESAAP